MSDYSQANLPSQSVFVSSNAVNPALDRPEASRELAITITQAASDRKAGDIVLLGVAEVSYLADYFVIVTGYSRAQVRAITQAIEDKVEQEWQRLPLRTEGQAEGTWVLQDYGEVMVHIMMPKEREFYNLEAFWGHAERIDFPASDVDGGISTMMESSVSVCPVPSEQQPLNEYEELKASRFFNTCALDLREYLTKIAWIWGLSWLVAGPVAAASFAPHKCTAQFILCGAVGASIGVVLALVRLYLAWSYVCARLVSSNIFYEESGWYDGQNWTKPAEVLTRDRLIVTYQVQPILQRLQRTLDF